MPYRSAICIKNVKIEDEGEEEGENWLKNIKNIIVFLKFLLLFKINM